MMEQRRWLMAAVLAAVFASLSPARAWAEGAPLPPDVAGAPAAPPKKNYVLPAQRVNIPETLLRLCGTLGAAERATLACDDGYWKAPETKALGRASGPPLAFKPPGQPATWTLCARVADRNGAAAPRPGADLHKLLDACGYREKPDPPRGRGLRRARSRGDEAGRAPGGRPQEGRAGEQGQGLPEPTRLRRGPVKKLAAADDQGSRWRGDVKQSPPVAPGGKPVCDLVDNTAPEGIPEVRNLQVACGCDEDERRPRRGPCVDGAHDRPAGLRRLPQGARPGRARRLRGRAAGAAVLRRQQASQRGQALPPTPAR